MFRRGETLGRHSGERHLGDVQERRDVEETFKKGDTRGNIQERRDTQETFRRGVTLGKR